MVVTVSNCIGKIALTTFSILNISEHKAHSDKIINFKKHVLLMNLKIQIFLFFSHTIFDFLSMQLSPITKFTYYTF